MGLLGRLGDAVSFFSEVTRVARFVAVAGATVPGESGISDAHLQGIHAPGLVPGTAAVLFYRTKHSQTPSFSVRLNSTPLTAETLSVEGAQSWHEVIPPGALLAENNELTLAVSSGSGSVTFSDLVILYTSDKLTVQKPPVAQQ